MSTTTTIVQNRNHLDGLLLELEERGYGEAAAFDGTTPYLLAACEIAGGAYWDAFSTHPYATENQPVGLEQPLELEYELEDEDRWNSGELRLYGISAERQHPGLSGLRYPLTVLHSPIGGPTPYLEEGAVDSSLEHHRSQTETEPTTESPEEAAPEPHSVTAVGIPTELLQRFQSEDAHFQEVFRTHTEPEELWTAAGELEPLQLEILELVAKAPLAGTANGGWVNNRAQVDELLARPNRSADSNSSWLAEIEADRRAEGSPDSEEI